MTIPDHILLTASDLASEAVAKQIDCDSLMGYAKLLRILVSERPALVEFIQSLSTSETVQVYDLAAKLYNDNCRLVMAITEIQ